MLKNRFRPKTCKNPDCRERYVPEKPFQEACGIPCAIVVGGIKTEKKRQAEKKEQRREIREAKQRLKTASEVAKEAQTAFNRFIRLRDYHQPCISCGVSGDRKWDAGHYRSQGNNPALRFDEDNTHKQCVPCNQHLSGNLVDYRIGLIARVGQEAVDRLEGPQPTLRLRKQDFEIVKARYRLKVRKLEEHLGLK